MSKKLRVFCVGNVGQTLGHKYEKKILSQELVPTFDLWLANSRNMSFDSNGLDTTKAMVSLDEQGEPMLMDSFMRKWRNEFA